MKKLLSALGIIVVCSVLLTACLSGHSSQAINSKNTILVYGDEQCWNCQHFRKSLSEAHINFVFYDVDADAAKNREMWDKIYALAPKTKQITFPIVDINGKVIMTHPITFQEIRGFLKY